MDRKIRSMKIESLKGKGFKVVKNYEALYINNTGEVFDLKTDSFLKHSGRYIRVCGKNLSIPKLVLQAFSGEKYKHGQIVFIDGNERNFSPENLKYARIFQDTPPEVINPENLEIAIRCYFRVNRSFTVKNLTVVKFYLGIIAERCNYFAVNYKLKTIEVFREYVKPLGKSIYDLAKEKGISARDCNYIIKNHINGVISTVLAKKQSGEVDVLPYVPTKRDAKRILLEKYISLHSANGRELTVEEIKEVKGLIFSSNEAREKKFIEKIKSKLAENSGL